MELRFEIANEAGERRRFGRLDTRRHASYLVTGERGEWKRCTITNLSRRGLGVAFRTDEKVKVGTPLLVRAFYPGALYPTHIIGMVRWTRKGKAGSTGGIEAIKTLEADSLYYSPLER